MRGEGHGSAYNCFIVGVCSVAAQMSNLVHAAQHGRLAVLDGIDQLSGGTLSTLQRLIADRDITLPDGTRLLRADRYDSLLRHSVNSGLTAEGPAARPRPI